MEDNHYLNFNKNTVQKVIEQRDNYIKKDGKFYTLDGEDISDLYTEEIRPIYTSEKQQKEYRSKEILGQHEKENGGFIFMFYKSLQNFNEIIPDLTKTDIARLLFLSTYISFEDNKIQYDNGTEITDKGMIELLRLNRNSYRKFINKLIDNRILFINEEGERFLSSEFCKYGFIDVKKLKQQQIGYIRLFRGTVRELFNSTPVREIGRLATIYMILPYLNLASNIVCHNPDETDIDKVVPMTLIELSEMLGYRDITKFRQSLYHIKIREDVAFGFFMIENDKRTMKLVINPAIVFAGDAEQLKVIQAFFKKAKRK